MAAFRTQATFINSLKGSGILRIGCQIQRNLSSSSRLCLLKPASGCRNFQFLNGKYLGRSQSWNSWNRHSHAAFGVTGIRWNSTESANGSVGAASSDLTNLPPGYIPEPPPLPEASDVIDQALSADQLNSLGEQTLSSLDLCNTSPAGLVQWGLEHLHVTCDLPWWGAIMCGTVVLRLLVFPLVVLAQRNAAHMNNHMPTIQALQEKFTQARISGNPMDAARSAAELGDYMSRNKVSPIKNMLVPMAQLPVFISVFVGVRQMANLPVESMKTGGLFWFTDLTVPDPIWGLPLLTCATFLATIELGVDGVRAQNMSHILRWVMRLMPIMMFPFISNFPTAMLCYWLTSNIISMFQVLLLKIPNVRTKLKIPEAVIHPKSVTKKKKFIEGFRDTWKNSKLLAQVEDRQRSDAKKFKEAGQGPLVKTYLHDPTKVSKSASKPK